MTFYIYLQLTPAAIYNYYEYFIPHCISETSANVRKCFFCRKFIPVITFKDNIIAFIFNRVIEMPYAYQCCVYGSCASYKSAGQWEAEHSDTDEDLHKRTVAMYPIHTDAHCKKTKPHI